jgi:hypothetical protein
MTTPATDPHLQIEGLIMAVSWRILGPFATMVVAGQRQTGGQGGVCCWIRYTHLEVVGVRRGRYQILRIATGASTSLELQQLVRPRGRPIA